MNTWQIIAYGNLNGANELLQKHGYHTSGDPEKVAVNLASLVSSEQSQAILNEIREIHPDKDLFEPAAPKKDRHHSCCGSHSANGEPDNGFSECAGCGGSCGGKKKERSLAADGSGNGGQNVQQIISQNQFNIMGLFVIAITAMVIMSFKKTA